MINYSYLQPPSKISKIKLPRDYIFTKINNRPLRRIFQNVQYQNFQLEAISKLKGILKLKKPNIYYKDWQLLHFYYMGNFMNSQINDNIKKYEEWHQNQTITILQKASRQILQKGVIYAYGRDYDYCPVVYVMANRISLKSYSADNYLSAVHNLLNPLKKHMLVGGVIEKWNVVVDCEGKKIGSTNFSIAIMEQCGIKIIQAFPFRIKRLLIVNYHQGNQPHLLTLNKILHSFNSEAEPQILKKVQQMNQYIGIQERQTKYGGNLSNLCEFWPIHTTNKYEQDKTIINHDQMSQSEYKSVTNELTYFEVDKKPPLCDLSNSKCDIY